LPPGGSILELGCGAGNHSAVMLEAGFKVRATDGSPEMAEIAARRRGHLQFTLMSKGSSSCSAPREIRNSMRSFLSVIYSRMPKSSNTIERG
jgi:trans-aconitate methyltransferase